MLMMMQRMSSLPLPLGTVKQVVCEDVHVFFFLVRITSFDRNGFFSNKLVGSLVQNLTHLATNSVQAPNKRYRLVWAEPKTYATRAI